MNGKHYGKKARSIRKVLAIKSDEPPTDVFDQLFIESFPYYLGVAENAIQYVVDTEMDDTPQLTDAATICQERFTPLLWHQTKRLKLPFDWVYDRPTRDIAELIRYMMIEKKKDWEKTIVQFVTDYERNYSLSSFGLAPIIYKALVPASLF